MILPLLTRRRLALTLIHSELLALIFLFLCSPALVTSIAPNNGLQQCADSKMEWYTTPTGETPCQTYQRLRRICNPLYNVGVMNTNTPPDTCDDQVADCCCNSVAFALSMLCLTCQQGVVNNIGFDAGKGAYQMYLTGPSSSFCNPNVNQSLPDSVQTAVCNEKINIFSNLYGLFWRDGSWYYVYTSQATTKSYNADSNAVHGSCSVKDTAPDPTPSGAPPAPASTPSTTTEPAKSSTTTTSALAASDASKTSSLISVSLTPDGSATPGVNTQNEINETSSSTSANAAQSTQSEGANTAQSTSGGGVSLGAIVGASLGSAAGVLLMVLGLILCWRRRRERRDLLKPTPMSQPSQPQDSMRQPEPNSGLSPVRRSSILGSSTTMSGMGYEAVDAEDAGSPFEARGYYASSRGSDSGPRSAIGLSRHGTGGSSRGMSPPAYDDLMGSESEYTESSYRTDGQSIANSTSGMLVSSGTEKSRRSRLGRPDVPLSVTDEEHFSS